MIETNTIKVHTVSVKMTHKQFEALPPESPWQIEELEYFDGQAHVVGQFEDICDAITANEWLAKYALLR